jgi:hypothetical protein
MNPDSGNQWIDKPSGPRPEEHEETTMDATSYEYTVECSGRGANANPCYYEIQMIEAACPLWRRADDLPYGTESAVLYFGGMEFTVYRKAQ